jgi:uncharacterized membrane protein (Fun14 family)
MRIENFSSLSAIVGDDLKKLIKIIAVIVGLFLAGLAYLQSQQIANINWDKLQHISEGAITTLSNAVITHIPGFNISSGNSSHAGISSLAMTSFGISFTGSISAGFTIGFRKE